MNAVQSGGVLGNIGWVVSGGGIVVVGVSFCFLALSGLRLLSLRGLKDLSLLLLSFVGEILRFLFLSLPVYYV